MKNLTLILILMLSSGAYAGHLSNEDAVAAVMNSPQVLAQKRISAPMLAGNLSSVTIRDTQAGVRTVVLRYSGGSGCLEVQVRALGPTEGYGNSDSAEIVSIEVKCLETTAHN